MKNILFISEASTKFRVLIDLALYFNKFPNYKSSFYLDDLTDPLMNEPEVCRQKNIPFFYSFRTQKQYSDIPVDTEKPSLGKKIANYIKFKTRPYFKTADKVKEYQKQIRLAEKFLKEKQINIIATCEDNYGVTPVFIKAGKNLNIRSVIFPFTISNHEEIAYAFRNEPFAQINGFWKKLFFIFNPAYKTYYNNNPLSYLHPHEIKAQKKCGIVIKAPFISVGGDTDYKFFESEFMFDYFRRSGFIPNKNSLITGSLKFDTLYTLSLKTDEKKQELLNELNLKNEKPIILCALPPDYYPTSLYKDHEDFVIHWLNVMTSITTHYTFINLHPRTKVADLPYLKDYNVNVINKPLEELIPLCNVFVASLSATIRYALALNKVVLNFDTVNVGYSEYKNIDQVKTVFTKEDFETTLRQLCLAVPVKVNNNQAML